MIKGLVARLLGFSTSDEPVCPNCGSKDVRQSRRRSYREDLQVRWLSVHAFRCKECGQRHYRVTRTGAAPANDG
jgi:uncharacterized Zn finger protein